MVLPWLLLSILPTCEGGDGTFLLNHVFSLAELRNDHKVITEKIDKNLQVLHSLRLDKVNPLPLEGSGMAMKEKTDICLGMFLRFRRTSRFACFILDIM